MNVLLPFVKSKQGRTFYSEFVHGLSEALQQLGHTTRWFMLEDIGLLSAAESETAVQWARSARCDLVLDVCCWGYALSMARLVGERDPDPVYDIAGTPCVGLLYDQPYFQALAAIQCKNLYAGVPDRDYPDLIARISPGRHLAGSVFLPPAVRPQSDRSRAWSERDIGILYVGNLQADALGRLWRNVPTARYYDAVADQALAEPERPMYLVAIEAVRSWGLDLSPDDLAGLLRGVEYFLRARLRYDAVMAVAASGLPMNIVGQGWEQVGLPASVTLHPTVDYDGFFDLAGRARVCLDASTYLNGANDRVFHYAVNGAVCFTNACGWLRNEFGDGNGLHCYRMKALSELPATLRALLAHPNQLREEAERARAIALSRHTWRHRAEEILGAVRPRAGK